jgi:hypothetical protein
MAWNKLTKSNGPVDKALQLSKALSAMGFTTWNSLESGDYNCLLVINARLCSYMQIYSKKY